ncbi:ROK family protein [Deinococcus sp.]|uniref:ROK family protein n=1 Tax=Deinococcus sp. TaxID=47478 RepID=UPI003B59A6DA
MTSTAQAPRAGDQRFLKHLNRSAILELVRWQPGMTRAELALKAQLTKVTVGTVVQHLLAEGWLSEGELQQGGMGRPGRALYLSDGHYLVLGAEVGVQGLRAVACSLGGQTLAERYIRRPTGTPQAAAASLGELIAGLLAEPGLRSRQVLGLGVALPGPVARPENRLLFAPNLGWRDIAFLDVLEPHLGGLAGSRLLENEASAAAFGEAYLNRKTLTGVLAYLSLGSGIGAGLIIGSPTPTLLRGAQHFAGEVGHSLVQQGGLYCHCGNRGCLETLLSGWAIRAALGVPPGEDLHSAVTSRLEESAVQVILRRAGEALGMLLTNLHHTLNPSDIVIGGSLSRLPGPLLPTALDFFAAHQHRLFGIDRPVNIEICPDSALLPARGAAAQVLAEAIQTLPTGG